MLALGALVVRAKAGLRSPPKRDPGSLLGLFGPARELTGTTWLVGGIHESRRYELRAERSLSLLDRYLEPSRNHTPEWQSFFRGAYGMASWSRWPSLRWGSDESAVEDPESEGFSSIELKAPGPIRPLDAAELGPLIDWALAHPAPEPEATGISPRRPCPRWKAPPLVTFVRFDGAESEQLALVDCGGGITSDAAERLAVLARPPGTPRPQLPLPPEPDAGAQPGEWLPHVRLLHPRLLWVVEKVAEAFPKRNISVMSGYRRDGHSGLHQKGRALDLYVAGIPNEQLFAFCKSLRDVGCGFYPNNKFVHIDVRPYGSPRVLWVDVSLPGAPSQYVDGWEGLIAPGTSWLPN